MIDPTRLLRRFAPSNDKDRKNSLRQERAATVWFSDAGFNGSGYLGNEAAKAEVQRIAEGGIAQKPELLHKYLKCYLALHN